MVKTEAFAEHLATHDNAVGSIEQFDSDVVGLDDVGKAVGSGEGSTEPKGVAGLVIRTVGRKEELLLGRGLMIAEEIGYLGTGGLEEKEEQE